MLHYKYDEQNPYNFYLYEGRKQIGVIEYNRHDSMVELERIWIEEIYRGQGYGQRFLEKFINICVKNSIKVIYLMTIEHYPDALHIYVKQGFKVTHNDGCIYMEKRL